MSRRLACGRHAIERGPRRARDDASDSRPASPVQLEIHAHVVVLDGNPFVADVACAHRNASDISITLTDVAAAESWAVGNILVGTNPSWHCVNARGKHGRPFHRAVTGIESLTVGGASVNVSTFDFEAAAGTPAVIAFTTTPVKGSDCIRTGSVHFTRKVGVVPAFVTSTEDTALSMPDDRRQLSCCKQVVNAFVGTVEPSLSSSADWSEHVNVFSWNWDDENHRAAADPVSLGDPIQCAGCYAYLDFDVDISVTFVVTTPTEISLHVSFSAGLNFAPFVSEQQGFDVDETYDIWSNDDLADFPIVAPFLYLTVGAYVDADIQITGGGDLALALPCEWSCRCKVCSATLVRLNYSLSARYYIHYLEAPQSQRTLTHSQLCAHTYIAFGLRRTTPRSHLCEWTTRLRCKRRQDQQLQPYRRLQRDHQREGSRLRQRLH